MFLTHNDDETVTVVDNAVDNSVSRHFEFSETPEGLVFINESASEENYEQVPDHVLLWVNDHTPENIIDWGN